LLLAIREEDMLAAVIAFERSAAKESNPESRVQKGFLGVARLLPTSLNSSANTAGAGLHDFSREGENRVYFAWARGLATSSGGLESI
jgi:hypothetical protein